MSQVTLPITLKASANFINVLRETAEGNRNAMAVLADAKTTFTVTNKTQLASMIKVLGLEGITARRGRVAGKLVAQLKGEEPAPVVRKPKAKAAPKAKAKAAPKAKAKAAPAKRKPAAKKAPAKGKDKAAIARMRAHKQKVKESLMG